MYGGFAREALWLCSCLFFSRHVQGGGMDVTHIEPLLRDRPLREHAIRRQPGALPSVPVARHLPVRIAFEEEDGLVCVGVVGRVQTPERVVPRLYRWEDLRHLLRTGTQDLISVDIKRKHLQSKESEAGFPEVTDVQRWSSASLSAPDPLGSQFLVPCGGMVCRCHTGLW